MDGRTRLPHRHGPRTHTVVARHRVLLPGEGGPTAVAVPVDDPADPRIADFAGLRDQGWVAPSEYFVAEGVLVIRQLLRSPFPLRSLLMTQRAWRDLEGELPDGEVYIASEAFMREVTGFDFHRGALASAARLPLPVPADVLANAHLVLAVEGVNDHENLGGLFRNAAAFGVDAVLLDRRTCDPLYRRSIRVSMGHILRIPFARAPHFGVLAASGFDVVALSPSAETKIENVQRRARQAVLVGAEGPGLTQAALAAADRTARIEMARGVDSLNVATAAAIALHRLCT